MATHSSILGRKIPLMRGAWCATFHGQQDGVTFYIFLLFIYLHLYILRASLQTLDRSESCFLIHFDNPCNLTVICKPFTSEVICGGLKSTIFLFVALFLLLCLNFPFYLVWKYYFFARINRFNKILLNSIKMIHRFHIRSPNPQNLRTWLYLEIGSLKR